MQKNTTWEEFQAMLSNVTDSGDFSFGFNWLDYVRNRLDHDIIDRHCKEFREIFDAAGLDIRGLDVLDVGSGSGLSSVSLCHMGAGQVHSIDLDPYSVEATALTRERFGPARAQWTVAPGNILDPASFDQTPRDLVYSWGVLHHTGDMWRAIRNTAALVRPDGWLYLALYISGDQLTQHLEQKFRYRLADRDKKIRMLYDHRGGKGLFKTNSRGMNRFHDTIDWLGGLPYEVCDPEVLRGYLAWAYGMQQVYYRPKGQGGNFVSVFRRTEKGNLC